jgi:hypothetical protein
MRSSLVSSLNYNNTRCAENEEASVRGPFHVQKSFREDESVLSIFRCWIFVNSAGKGFRRFLGYSVYSFFTGLHPISIIIIAVVAGFVQSP